jgi:hypothetical protein
MPVSVDAPVEPRLRQAPLSTALKLGVESHGKLCNEGLDTDAQNRHPINVLFASKVASLTGCMNGFSQAYTACREWLKEWEGS